MISPKTGGRSATILSAAAILLMLPSRNTSASMLTIIAPSATLMPGQSETVSVQLTLTQTILLGSANIEIQYDNTRFSVGNVTLGTLDANPTNDPNGYAIGTNLLTSNPGVIYAGIDSGQDQSTISAGTTGTLETFTLTALANAPQGGALGDINLLQKEISGGGIPTNVIDQNTNAAIVLTPAPTNGYDATIDATVTVVPEPSSLILMGLGGGLIVLTSRFRKKARRPSVA